MSAATLRDRLRRAVGRGASASDLLPILEDVVQEQTELHQLEQIGRGWLDVELSRLSHPRAVPSDAALDRLNAILRTGAPCPDPDA